MARSRVIRGLSNVIDTLDGLSEVLVVDLDNEIAASALEINGEAIDRIAFYKAQDTGELQQKQQFIPHTAERRYEIVNTAPYAGFVHFGTGNRVQVSREWVDIAAQLKGQKSGNFAEFLQRITEWCRRKGIPESAAYVICIHILKEGLEARPFLEDAFNKVYPDMIKRINKLIKDAL